jgi:hypothetical protein
MTGGRLRSAIRNADSGCYSGLPSRCPCHQGMRRGRWHDPEPRRQPPHIANPANPHRMLGHPTYNHRPGRAIRTDHRFRRLPCQRRPHRPVQPPLPKLRPGNFGYPSQSPNRHNRRSGQHRHHRLCRSLPHRNHPRSYPPSNFRRPNHSRARLRGSPGRPSRSLPRLIRSHHQARRNRRCIPGHHQARRNRRCIPGHHQARRNRRCIPGRHQARRNRRCIPGRHQARRNRRCIPGRHQACRNRLGPRLPSANDACSSGE